MKTEDIFDQTEKKLIAAIADKLAGGDEAAVEKAAAILGVVLDVLDEDGWRIVG